MNYGGIGYGNLGFNLAGLGFLEILSLAAIIALSIIGYRMFLGKESRINRANAWGKFFNFDHLYINKILKATFLIFSIINLVSAIALPFTLAVAGGGAGGFLIGLLFGIIGFFVIELMLRLGYEYTIMFVRMAIDVRHLRRAQLGDEAAYAETIDQSLFSALRNNRPVMPRTAPATAPAYTATGAPVVPFDNDAQSEGVVRTPAATAQQAPAPTGANEPANEAVSEPASAGAPMPQNNGVWTCPHCGNTEAFGNFCGQCGTPRS